MATTKRAEDLQRGDRITIKGLGNGGTVLGTSLAADPDLLRLSYRYGSESWQKTTINIRRDALVALEG